MTRFGAPQKGFPMVPASACAGHVDRPVATVWYGAKEAFKGLIQVVRRTRMASKSTDPVTLLQTRMGEMEKGFNAFANQAMTSPEFSKAMNQAGGVTAGAQKQFGEFMEKYLLSMNLPSRAQMIGMAQRVPTVEGQLNEEKAMLR